MPTLGSLFDGIGGFPLAAVRNGIEPVWASEIEAFPIEVTRKRFPSMLHVGDITKLNGAELPPVDIITGGSPCQDLSVAGARAGLAGERSGLFMEQIRVVKEMRDADERRGRTAHTVRPRYMCWENVPGSFSSAGGEDFRIVLEEIVRIKDGSCSVPRPDSGRWESAGAIILGNQFSLAWRVMDPLLARAAAIAENENSSFAEALSLAAAERGTPLRRVFADEAEALSHDLGHGGAAEQRAVIDLDNGRIRLEYDHRAGSLRESLDALANHFPTAGANRIQNRLIAFLAEHDGSEELYKTLHNELGLTNQEIEAMGFDLAHRYEPDCDDAYQDIVDYIRFEQETSKM